MEGPSRTFTFDRDLGYRVREFTRTSRFVLYDNGALVLQYERIGNYRGAFFDTEANGILTFQWGGADGATGTIAGDSLTVRFSERMQQADFQDAVYVLSRE